MFLFLQPEDNKKENLKIILRIIYNAALKIINCDAISCNKVRLKFIRLLLRINGFENKKCGY